jgi:hypothetical protein
LGTPRGRYDEHSSKFSLSEKKRNSLLFDGITPTVLAWKIKLRNDLQLLLHRIRSDRHDVIKELIAVL